MSNVGINPLEASTRPIVGMGQRGEVTTENGDGDKHYMHVRAGSALAVGEVVIMTPAFVAALATKTRGDNANAGAGVVVAALANGEYGWVQTLGKTKVNSGGIAATGDAYTSTTAGRIDDATAGQRRIYGIKVGATTAGVVDAVLTSYPTV